MSPKNIFRCQANSIATLRNSTDCLPLVVLPVPPKFTRANRTSGHRDSEKRQPANASHSRLHQKPPRGDPSTTEHDRRQHTQAGRQSPVLVLPVPPKFTHANRTSGHRDSEHGLTALNSPFPVTSKVTARRPIHNRA